jgi:hypothetical protein
MSETRPRELDPNDYHGCLTGDCPHDKQSECDAALAIHWKEAYAQLQSELAEKDKQMMVLMDKCTEHVIALNAEREKVKALAEIMEHKQKTIAVMDHDLICRGVNFDYSKVDERHAELKSLGEDSK